MRTSGSILCRGRFIRPRLFAFYDCKGAVIGKGFLGFVGAGAWQEIGCRSDCEMQGGGYEKESVVKRIYGEQMRGVEPKTARECTFVHDRAG